MTRSFYRRPADHFRLMLEISWVFLQSWYIYSLLKSLRKYYINEARNHKLRNIQHKERVNPRYEAMEEESNKKKKIKLQMYCHKPSQQAF